MIWLGLPAFLVQFALELCRPLPVHLPAWCSFGGIIAPTPTNMGKEEYLYALMVCEDPDLYDGKNCVMYQFSGIPSVEDGAFKAWDTDLIVRSYHVRGNVWKKESAFTIAKGASAKARYTNFVWSNFDLYTMDAQLLLTASEFLPATDYTTTLFEGDVTTVEKDYIITNPSTGQQYPYTLNGAHAVISDSAMLDSYGLLRITVDEVPVGYKIQSLMLGDYAGNLWLTDAEQKDTGGGFGVLSFGLTGETLFLTREPGTYHVKVEKIERRAQIVEPEQPWETLFEGEAVTAYGDEPTVPFYKADNTYQEDQWFGDGDEVRITIDGISYLYTAKTSGLTRKAGNPALQPDADDSTADDGTPVSVRLTTIISIASLYIYTRNPGTYRVKIEWRADE